MRKFSRDWYAGYADTDFGQETSELEILDTTGKVLRMNWEQIKWLCFVRDLPTGATDQTNPERLLHKRFSIRPRTAGLWLRLKLNDGDEMEGLAANDRSLIDGRGLMLTPPDIRSNTQRIYIPRPAVQTLEVLSLIGATVHKKHTTTAQPELFGRDDEPS